ncbi:alkaline phosphatase D family protein [Knoellia aerolata]|uniref:PhoD-like phosphatase metallophosphatase domain-containing protein n=1 Tax=Knoellia aerolata DSM 18566 TaxID=1385519 RepID=A0A0A0JXA7_9MICO|nr:alkaline phosphatase D family protein [Knoellia aerolata]KGN40707.1 hypothetical protein N801_12800 [Knoellia aerolata DSM 18566]
MTPAPEAAVIVPAILGVGLVFSAGAVVHDTFSRVHGQRWLERIAALNGRATGVTALQGMEGAAQDRGGLRRRRTYAVWGASALGLAIYVAIGAVGNFVGLTPWSEGVAWVLALLLACSAGFGVVGVASLAVAVRFRRPPPWARRVVGLTPMTTVPRSPSPGPRLRVRPAGVRLLGPHPVGDRVVAVARFVATVWGLCATSLFGFLATRGLIPQADTGLTVEADLVVPVQVGLLVAFGLGTLVARRAEMVGATVMAVAGAGLAILAGIQYPPAVGVGVGIVFFVPAFLRWLAWQRDREAVHIRRLLVVTVLLVGGVWFGADRVYARYFGPAHPETTASALPSSAVEWVWAGGTSPHQTTVVAKLRSAHGRVRVALAEASDLGDARFSAPESVDPGDRSIVRATFEGLRPDTTYHYAVEADGRLDLVRRGQLRTFPDGAGSFGVAFSSCAVTGSNGAVFDAIRDQRPLAYLAIGDIHYANIVENDRSLFRKALDRTLASTAQSALYRSTSVGYVWDDHDYAGNDANETARTRPAAQAVYREYVPHYPLTGDADGGPVFQAFSIGRVRFLLTDTRSTRTPQAAADDASKFLLGREQERWLVDELARARDRDGIVVWVNPNPWVAGASQGADDWGGYTTQRSRLADVVASYGLTDRLVMLGGDAHMLALDDGTHSQYSTMVTKGFPVLHAGPLDRPPSPKGGPYTDGPFLEAGQFGMLRVRDDGGETITVGLSGHTWNHRTLVDRSFTLRAQASP